MHKIIPIRCIGECIICYSKTINKNCCIQCNSCILCNECRRRNIARCPICRKEHFRGKRSFECPVVFCPTLMSFGVFVVFTFFCFSVGSFVQIVSGDVKFEAIDFLMNTLLGLILVGTVMSLFICFKVCVKNL